MKNSVIIKPIISEKSTKETKSNKFTFRVDKEANKKTIKKAIEDQFKVTVLDVSTSVIKGKRKRIGKSRTEVNDSVWKKATVRLTVGQTISWFDVGGKKK